MADLMTPKTGNVMLEDEPVLGPREDVGMVFQQATLLAWKTALDNIVLPVKVRDGDNAARAAKQRAKELFDLVGLADSAHAYPNELSGGMRTDTRVSFTAEYATRFRTNYLSQLTRPEFEPIYSLVATQVSFFEKARYTHKRCLTSYKGKTLR